MSKTKTKNKSKIPYGIAIGNLRFANSRLEKAILNSDVIAIRNAVVLVKDMIDNLSYNSTKENISENIIQMWSAIYDDSIQAADTNLKIAASQLSSSMRLI